MSKREIEKHAQALAEHTKRQRDKETKRQRDKLKNMNRPWYKIEKKKEIEKKKARVERTIFS